jgi:hypothetical protein
MEGKWCLLYIPKMAFIQYVEDSKKYYPGDRNESVITLEASWDCLLRSSVLVFLSKMLIKYEIFKYV